MEEPKILCLIPARSGSKGIKHKNLALYKGRPLVFHAIDQALECSKVYPMRIIVSTDCEKYKKIIEEEYNSLVEVPFLRPKTISNDLSTDFEFVDHALNWLSINEPEYTHPDFILHLRPSQPARTSSTIEDCIRTFLNVKEQYDSLRTVYPTHSKPFKSYTIENETLVPLFKEYKEITHEPFNQCRQLFPDTYLHNGYVDIVKFETVNKKRSISGKMFPYIMETCHDKDIDTPEDLKYANLPS